MRKEKKRRGKGGLEGILVDSTRSKTKILAASTFLVHTSHVMVEYDTVLGQNNTC